MMTSVEIARRATRHLTVSDPSAMAPEEAIQILDAINGALNRYFRYADDQYKRTTATERLLAPVTRTGISIDENGTTLTGGSFLQSERGKSVVIPGDAQYNEIVATDQVLRPFIGSGGASNVSGTIYSDAVPIRNFAVERLASHPRIIETNTTLVPISNGAGTNLNGDPWHRDTGAWYNNTTSRRQGEPTVYMVSYVGGSIDTADEDAVMIVHIDPVPAQALTIEFDIIIRAINLDIASLVTPVALPIHESVFADTFFPLIEGALTASDLWKADPRMTERILDRETKALRDIRLLPKAFHNPTRRVGTVRGF